MKKTIKIVLMTTLSYLFRMDRRGFKNMKCAHPENKGNECTEGSCPLAYTQEYEDVSNNCRYRREWNYKPRVGF